MRLYILTLYLVLTLGLVSSSAHAADLPVVAVSELGLPFTLSPSNFNNSSSNFNNSLSNFNNSSSNFANSESNFDNSASNFKNGPTGDRRLLYKNGDGTSMFVGYYVVADNGTTNFFSPSGTRVFFDPKNGLGVFDAKDGNFCGVLTRVKGVFSLALTESGVKILLLSQ
jgi:hypothetical protein